MLPVEAARPGVHLPVQEGLAPRHRRRRSHPRRRHPSPTRPPHPKRSSSRLIGPTPTHAPTPVRARLDLAIGWKSNEGFVMNGKYFPLTAWDGKE